VAFDKLLPTTFNAFCAALSPDWARLIKFIGIDPYQRRRR